jgi:hypothetical protein
MLLYKSLEHAHRGIRRARPEQLPLCAQPDLDVELDLPPPNCVTPGDAPLA